MRDRKTVEGKYLRLRAQAGYAGYDLDKFKALHNLSKVELIEVAARLGAAARGHVGPVEGLNEALRCHRQLKDEGIFV